MPTSIPRNFMPAMFRPRGIIQAGRTDLTRLWSAKIQTISLRWPAFRQPRVDNQRKDKRVESYLVRCLDGGSSPPISTKTALSCAEGRFCGDTPLLCSGALLCLGALPLLYPAAPPSVFAFGKYTAPAVALVREVSAVLRAIFLICGDTRLQGKRFPFSTPVSCADSPFQGHAACAFVSGRWLRCFNFLAEVSLTLRHGG